MSQKQNFFGATLFFSIQPSQTQRPQHIRTPKLLWNIFFYSRSNVHVNFIIEFTAPKKAILPTFCVKITTYSDLKAKETGKNNLRHWKAVSLAGFLVLGWSSSIYKSGDGIVGVLVNTPHLFIL